MVEYFKHRRVDIFIELKLQSTINHEVVKLLCHAFGIQGYH